MPKVVINPHYRIEETMYTSNEIRQISLENRFLKIMRSKADPSIIALHIGGNFAVKIKQADKPYPGESKPGSRFNFNLRHWDYVNDHDAQFYVLNWLNPRYMGG